MKLLLHICCGPCSIYPVRILRDEGIEVMGFFKNDNIHPFTEHEKRREALVDYTAETGLRVFYSEEYKMEEFLRSVVFRESDRCVVCYYQRLKATALFAKKGKFDAISTTLLYSKFQNHDLIRQTGEAVAKEAGIDFLYRDFREGWKEGIEESKRLGMYRQQYCGCIYSEKERFFKQSAKV